MMRPIAWLHQHGWMVGLAVRENSKMFKERGPETVSYTYSKCARYLQTLGDHPIHNSVIVELGEDGEKQLPCRIRPTIR